MARVGSSLAAPVTRLLAAWGQGDGQALEQLTPLVYKELRRLAQWHMNGERPGHTLQATALVNEAYLRLVDVNQIQWRDRAHFLAMAARQMRRILIDAARKHRNQKHGGDVQNVSLAEGLVVVDRSEELVALDEVLVALAQIDERRGRVVEMKFFQQVERRGDRRSARRVARYGEARLETGEGVVGTGASQDWATRLGFGE